MDPATDGEHRKSRQQLLLTAALFSTGGVAIKAIHMTGAQVGCLRSGVAAIAVLLVVPGARRNWSAPVVLTAIAYAFTLVSYAVANKLTTGANAIFLQDTAPLYVFLLGAMFLGERPNRSDYFFMAPIALGMLLFFAGSDRALQTATNPALGNWFAAFSGLGYALLVVGVRQLARHGKPGAAVATVGLGNVLAFVGTLPFAWPLPAGRPVDWAVLIYLGVFQIAIAYVLMTRAMRHVPAFEASLLLLLEPVLNPLWTWLVYRERPNNLALAGGLLIIGATGGRTLWVARRSLAQTFTGTTNGLR